MPEYELLTTQEVADYLRTTIRTVREMIKAGKLRGVKVGKEYRVQKKDVEAYLNGLQSSPEKSV